MITCNQILPNALKSITPFAKTFIVYFKHFSDDRREEYIHIVELSISLKHKNLQLQIQVLLELWANL